MKGFRIVGVTKYVDELDKALEPLAVESGRRPGYARDMKVHYSKDRTRRAWYDRHERLWTMTQIDPQGNQVGDADYGGGREMALRWVRTGEWTAQRRPKL